MTVRLTAAFAAGLLFASCGGSASSGSTGAPADLSDAVATGDVARVAALLDDGADPDVLDGNGLTPLMSAANRGDPEMVRVLVEGGADVGAAGMAGLTALHVAAAADAVDAAQTLLQLDADPHTRSDGGMNALDHAADAGALATIRLLSDHVPLDEPSEVVVQGHGAPRDIGPTPLALSVRAGRTEAVELLVELGADPDGASTAGHTPLLTAVFSDRSPEIVEILLDAGADPGVSIACDRGCSTAVSGTAHDAVEWAEALERNELVPVLDQGR